MIQYRSVTVTQPATQPPSDVAVAITLNAQASSLKMKEALRDANTARALAVVRFGHRPPAVTNPQTGPITIHCAAAS